MRIATFNINGINTRLANLLEWLEAARPDVACLQELKATGAQFPAAAIRALGYHAVWKGEHRWNGVAILARDAEPVVTRRSLPGEPADAQSRYLEAAVGGVLIASLYLPNGRGAAAEGCRGGPGGARARAGQRSRAGMDRTGLKPWRES